VSGFDLCLPSSLSNILPVIIEHHRLSRAGPRMVCGPVRAAGLLVAVLMGGHWPAARASPPVGDLVRADLIAEPSAIAAGQPFWVAVRLRMLEGWHVYWRNPGDSGEAPSINWHLPPGFAASPIAWPTPQRIPVAHLVNFGYTGETTLLTQITPPDVLAGQGGVNIQADVTWLVCERECIPGEAHLSLDLPRAGGGTTPQNGPQDARTAGIFEIARRALPRPAPWPARMELAQDRITLMVDGAPSWPTARAAYFFPNAEVLVRHAAPQELSIVRGRLRLRLERSALSTTPPTDAGGVLLVEGTDRSAGARQAFELATVAIDEASAPPQATSLTAVLQAAALALLGGLILNLMPCVFPVLSIKVLALMDQAGGSRQQLRRHGFSYTAGVLLAFITLGSALIALRAAGAEVGWGFALQSPVAVGLFAYLLLAMGLSLSGVFHLGSSLQGVGRGLAQRGGLSGSLFAGALAAVVATPCTAPFMGTALGFAFTQPAPVALSVMLALGLGLALPYLGLTLAPRLIPCLPRPGAWMETLRQGLAFPVYATVAWLVWVLSQQVGPAGLFAALAGLVLVGLAAWAFNTAHSAGGWGRRAALSGLLASLVGIAVALAGLERNPGEPTGAAPSTVARHEPFTQARLAALMAAHRPVFVNLTAAWCITCLVNERVGLASEAVAAAFAAKGITYLKGDWTRRNPEITRLLETHGRSGVPLYLLYAGDGEPTVLPQILTPATVLAEVARLPDPAQHRDSDRDSSLPTPARE
jgi:thiol:disulfide interchange protein DsbD